MWKEKLENVKALITKQKDKGNKKNIENLVVFLILLIVTIIAINTIWKDEEKEEIEETNITGKMLAEKNSEKTNGEQEELEKRLAYILGKIEGVGKVSVLITYSETSEVVAMYNESKKESATEEADTRRRN